jgi:hypothetical protein
MDHTGVAESSRTINAFLARLSEITDSRIAIEVPRVDPLLWTEAIEAGKFQGFAVRMIEISDLIVNANVLEKLRLRAQATSERR